MFERSVPEENPMSEQPRTTPENRSANPADLETRMSQIETYLPVIASKISSLREELAVAEASIAEAKSRQGRAKDYEREFEELGLNGETGGLLQLLAARSGESKASILGKALNLFGIALTSIEIGNRLAILNDEDEIVREIIGFDPMPSTADHSS
jgi:hypothetical protein